MGTERALETVRELGARMEGTPTLLRETAAMPLPHRVPPFDDGVVMTGVGMSWSVAHLVATFARRVLRRPVEAAPLTSFLSGEAEALGRHLLVFSQELSPNSLVALRHARHFATATLVTSLPEADRRLGAFVGEGGHVITVGPPQERDFLVRVMGPRAAALMGLRLSLKGCGHDPTIDGVQLERAVRAAFARGRAGTLTSDRPVLVAEGLWSELLQPLAWTWMEALWTDAPAVHDALNLVHGGWQQLSARPHEVLVLKGALETGPLWRRVTKLLAGSPHRVTTSEATLPGLLAFLEHAAFIDGVILSRLEATPRDLTAWPGKGTDGPLYEWSGG
ncbi:MAG: hypothetical protein JNJ54_25270 [Myxococcaceae bacterium]|nr:hypothetical protein [Myxococcaceae bacterium]